MLCGFSMKRLTHPSGPTSATPKRRGSSTGMTQATASACSCARKEKSASMSVSEKHTIMGPCMYSRASHSAWLWPFISVCTTKCALNSG
jgi:hypothetical protein